jgi:hypothetical protein
LKGKNFLAGMGENLAEIGSLVMKFYVFFSFLVSGKSIKGQIWETLKTFQLFIKIIISLCLFSTEIYYFEQKKSIFFKKRGKKGGKQTNSLP